MNYEKLINPRLFQIPDYDQSHVTKCWQDPSIHRNMSNESNYSPIQAVQDAICEAGKDANYYAEDPTYAVSLREKLAAYSARLVRTFVGHVPTSEPSTSPSLSVSPS